MLKLEQAIKLKEAGWDQNLGVRVYYVNCFEAAYTIDRRIFAFPEPCDFDKRPWYAAPSCEEMMDFLFKQGCSISVSAEGFCLTDGNEIHLHIENAYDLTDALFDSCCLVLNIKSKESK